MNNKINFTLKTLVANLILSVILIAGGIIFIIWNFYGDAIMTPAKAIPIGILVIVLGLFISSFSIIKFISINKKYNKQHIVTNKKSSNLTKIEYLQPLPKIFTNKNDEDFDFDDEQNFKKEFALKSYKLPENLKAFSNSDKLYHYKDDSRLDIIPIKFKDIEERAYFYLMDSDCFNIPPHCVPFAEDESAGEVIYVLDYNLCGKQGEPRVLCIDKTKIKYEDDAETDDWGDEVIDSYIYNEEVIANSFSEFLSKLENVNL